MMTHAFRLLGSLRLACFGVLVPALLIGELSLAAPAEGAPAPAPAKNDSAPGDELGRTRPKDESVAEIRARLEGGLVELGRLVNTAREDNDAQRSQCLLDKHERGSAALELATSELLILQDAQATAEQKEFAREKMQAAADRVGRLVEEAGKCSGESADAHDGDTRNVVDAPKLIPVEDPTVGGAAPPVPPLVPIEQNPPTYASPSL